MALSPVVTIDKITQLPGPGRPDVYDYGFACAVCGETVVARDRVQLVKYRVSRTLCETHIAQWVAHHELTRPLCPAEACVECGGRRGNTRPVVSEYGAYRNGYKTRCAPCYHALLDARDARHAEVARRKAEAAAPRRTRYLGPGRHGYVYRLYDSQGALLYVGKTYHVERRFFQGPTAHAAVKSWFRSVSRVVVTVYRTEADALDAEALAIGREAPRYNIQRPTPRATRAPRRLLRYEGTLA